MSLIKWFSHNKKNIVNKENVVQEKHYNWGTLRPLVEEYTLNQLNHIAYFGPIVAQLKDMTEIKTHYDTVFYCDRLRKTTNEERIRVDQHHVIGHKFVLTFVDLSGDKIDITENPPQSCMKLIDEIMDATYQKEEANINSAIEVYQKKNSHMDCCMCGRSIFNYQSAQWEDAQTGEKIKGLKCNQCGTYVMKSNDSRPCTFQPGDDDYKEAIENSIAI